MNGALLMVWRVWDLIYYWCTRLVYVDRRSQNIFRVVTKKYWGRPLRVNGHTAIDTGNDYLKLHIHNCQLAWRLKGVKGDTRLGLMALREIRKSLPALARYVAEHPQSDRIAGIVGTTILYQGARPLGFHVQDIDSRLFRWYKTVFFKLILSLCHPSGFKRVRYKSDKLVAKHVFMPKEELLQRYLEQK